MIAGIAYLENFLACLRNVLGALLFLMYGLALKLIIEHQWFNWHGYANDGQPFYFIYLWNNLENSRDTINISPKVFCNLLSALWFSNLSTTWNSFFWLEAQSSIVLYGSKQVVPCSSGTHLYISAEYDHVFIWSSVEAVYTQIQTLIELAHVLSQYWETKCARENNAKGSF